MGSLLAYELAVRFQKNTVALYVAACRAPHLPRQDLNLGDLSDDEALINKLRQLNGTGRSLAKSRVIGDYITHFAR